MAINLYNLRHYFLIVSLDSLKVRLYVEVLAFLGAIFTLYNNRLITPPDKTDHQLLPPFLCMRARARFSRHSARDTNFRAKTFSHFKFN